jgi:hypothetical protein
MTTARTKTIEALESVAADSRVLLDKALSINRVIDGERLCIRKLDVTAIYKTQETAECMLQEMELRAMVAG